MADNIVLIGMSGAGKSTLGVLLAKVLGMGFVDTDLLIQQREGRLLQQLLDQDGLDAFLAVEEDVVSGLVAHNTVIATGGSVVYSQAAMQALKAAGTLVYLEVSFQELKRRLTNIAGRGIVMRPGCTLEDVFRERQPLYEAWSDLTIPCPEHSDVEDSVRRLVQALG